MKSTSNILHAQGGVREICVHRNRLCRKNPIKLSLMDSFGHICINRSLNHVWSTHFQSCHQFSEMYMVQLKIFSKFDRSSYYSIRGFPLDHAQNRILIIRKSNYFLLQNLIGFSRSFKWIRIYDYSLIIFILSPFPFLLPVNTKEREKKTWQTSHYIILNHF